MSEIVSASPIPSNLVDFSYEKILTNPKVLAECYKLTEQYLNKYSDPEIAAKHIVFALARQCSALGALTAHQSPSYVAIDYALNSCDFLGAYGLELKMVLTIAILMGHNIDDEEVKAFILTHLASTTISRMIRGGVIQLGTKSTIRLIDSIPGKSLGKLNHALGHRVFTKRGKTGDFNLIAYAFLGGMAVGAAFDFAGAYSIGQAALREFRKDDLPKATAKEIKSENSDVAWPGKCSR